MSLPPGTTPDVAQDIRDIVHFGSTVPLPVIRFSLKRVVTHHLEISVDPTDVGQDWSRDVRLDGDRVALTAEPYVMKSGERARNRFTWERVRSP